MVGYCFLAAIIRSSPGLGMESFTTGSSQILGRMGKMETCDTALARASQRLWEVINGVRLQPKLELGDWWIDGLRREMRSAAYPARREPLQRPAVVAASKASLVPRCSLIQMAPCQLCLRVHLAQLPRRPTRKYYQVSRTLPDTQQHAMSSESYCALEGD
jgi:hypothetical protein